MLQAVFCSEKFLQFSSTHVGYYKKFSSWSDAFGNHSPQLKCQHRRRHHDDDHQKLWFSTKFVSNLKFCFRIFSENSFSTMSGNVMWYVSPHSKKKFFWKKFKIANVTMDIQAIIKRSSNYYIFNLICKMKNVKCKMNNLKFKI